jgi:hypothetical protein
MCPGVSTTRIEPSRVRLAERANCPRGPASYANGVGSRVWTTPFELGRKVIERGVARGELREDIPPATILATFVGPLYVRLLITDERIDDEFIEAVIDTGLDGARVAGWRG